jgi:hypothetical protein
MAEGWLRDGSPTRKLAAVGLWVLVVGSATGCASSGGAQAEPGQASHATVAHEAPTAVTTLAALPARRTGAVRPERPVSTRLPSGRVVPVLPVGTRPDGELAVPQDIRVAGWWRGGSRIGDPFGSTLVAAHVDSFTQGLGPYAELLSVRPGQRIVVRSAHLRQAFSVTSLRLVPQGTLDRQGWIYAASGSRRLTLVTCAGPYVPSRGGYQNLAVVTASPVSVAVRRP